MVDPHGTRDLFLVDLREETHGFLDGRAVSWYADNDFGNVGQPPALIEKDEAARLAALTGETVQVFTIKDDPRDNRAQQRMMPVSYEEIGVVKPETEKQRFDGLEIDNCTIHYVRIPVTDHCGPSDAALAELRTRVPVSAIPRPPGCTSTATAATAARRRSSPSTTCCAGSSRTSHSRIPGSRTSPVASAGSFPTA